MDDENKDKDAVNSEEEVVEGTEGAAAPEVTEEGATEEVAPEATEASEEPAAE